MAVRREPTTPVYENTTMNKVFINEVHKLYEIKAVDGYVLHDKNLDIVIEDEFGNTHCELWYTPNEVSCLTNYDFVANPREFYTVPRNTISEDVILGGSNNDHEIM